MCEQTRQMKIVFQGLIRLFQIFGFSVITEFIILNQFIWEHANPMYIPWDKKCSLNDRNNTMYLI